MTNIRLLQPASFTPSVVEQVLDLGMRSGTWQVPDQEYYREQFSNPRNINLVLEDEAGSIIGYILAKPHDEAVNDYCLEDPAMVKSNVPAFYVDIVMVDRERVKRPVSMLLVHEMIKEANRRGATRFSMHARVVNGYSAVIQRRFKGCEVRRLDHYVDCNNEPFDYIEVSVDLGLGDGQ